MSEKYILDGGTQIMECNDLTEWARWMEMTDRKVAKEETINGDISTIFLGLDHSFGDGPPLLFESLVFGGTLDQEMDRYETWEQAEVGHKAMVKRCVDAVAKTEGNNDD